MKEQILGISITFNLEIIDKLFMCQYYFCLMYKYPVDSSVSTIDILINTCKRPYRVSHSDGMVLCVS